MVKGVFPVRCVMVKEIDIAMNVMNTTSANIVMEVNVLAAMAKVKNSITIIAKIVKELEQYPGYDEG